MANLSPEELADKQIKNLTNNVESWRQGVQRTKKRPMELAKAAIPKTKQRFIQAVDNGSMAAGLDGVSHAEWVDKTVTKGQDRIGPGVEAARDTITQFHRQLGAFIDRTQGEIDAMPSLTKSDNRARMNANFDRMEKFRFVKRPK